MRSLNKNIIFVHTRGNWWDHRYYYKQMPALIEGGFNVTYLVEKDSSINDSSLNIIQLSGKKIKLIRLTGGLNLLLIILRSKNRIVQICNLELLPLGIALSLFTRSKVFYDCREDHYNAMLFSKTWFPKWIRYILAQSVKFIEFLASATFTGFIVSDPAIYSMHRFMPSKKKMLFYNMALKSQFIDQNFNERLDSSTFDLTVLGSMSIRTGVLDVVEAIAELKRMERKVTLKLIGDPRKDKVLWDKILQIINKENLDDCITITGKVPYSKVPETLKGCKIAIIPLLNLPKFQNNIATKQFEYMASSLAIISSKLVPQQYFIKEGFNGLFYEAGNVNDLKDKIVSLLDNPDEINRLGLNGRKKILEDWNAENQQKKYLEFYNLRLKKLPYTENQLPPIVI